MPAVRDNAPKPPLFKGVTIAEGGLSGGFEYFSVGTVLLSWGRYVNPTSEKPKTRRQKNSLDLQNLNELTLGDYVVHSSYGVGTFGGIQKIKSDGITKDFIKINYAKSDVLYVPITQLDMVSKYVGGKEGAAVKINRLGSDEWKNQKRRVQKHVKDIADKLVKIYAERMKAKGYAFDRDTEWQREFEDRFEYPETFDQLKAAEEIKHDMERSVPMDRLLCGDVGFGKTEVALRAAFKCMIEGRQCAILVPTTILAWQHFQTAAARFDAYPFRVELLSRFRSTKQQEEILRRLKRGDIDLIIGTHKLIQKNVEFNDLGLAIIDEEQRFGVAQKEKFKEKFPAVDILTLSATPIPRTLNMAMSGLRDISSLDEPPQDRHPVQTYIIDHDDGMIAEAIHRELRRGGQVFYLHNKIEDIERTAEKVSKMAPEARIVVGHGQMHEDALSEVWRKLLDHEADILVCTTIIETGVDIPNCNTLQFRTGAAPSDPRTRGTKLPQGVRLSHGAALQVAHRDSQQASAGDTRIYRIRLRHQDRHARPADTRRGQSAWRGSVGTGGERRLRYVYENAQRGSPQRQGRSAARAGCGMSCRHPHRSPHSGELHRILAAAAGGLPHDRVGTQRDGRHGRDRRADRPLRRAAQGGLRTDHGIAAPQRRSRSGHSRNTPVGRQIPALQQESQP